MMGALIGLATESGMFLGVGIGAISGAVLSIEVIDSSLDLWHSNGSGIWSILYMFEEDLVLKQQLELYIERVQDTDPGVQKLTLESMRIGTEHEKLSFELDVGLFSQVKLI